ncbi:MAG TPA: alpha/beta hydrolase [Rhizomicrobium sp.]|jgi:pimeloyl-ACP methyl ester carboxylesterase|nr:alpha/beta hydrolase [Rhizomicrobium sp.]
MQVSVNGARIFFDTVGSGLAIAGERMVQKPALIVMHGGPGFDHSTMRPYFDRFADSHQVIYIDHRGNGRSTGEPETWSLAQWGDDVKAFCDALGIEKPVVFGQSFGGMVAIAYATRHPQHPAKVVFSSTAARIHLDETFAILEARGGAEARAAAERFWLRPDDAAFADYVRICMPHYNPPGAVTEGQAAARRRAITKPEVTRHFSLGEMLRMDAREALAGVACPALVLAGSYDPITPVSCAREIFDALPPGMRQLEIFEGAGHGIYRDKPDEAEALLRRFFA